MANLFYWDLGFDFAAVQKKNTLSYLQNGLVLNGASAFPNKVNTGDTIIFNLFNLTSGATQGDGTKIHHALLSFTHAVTGQTATTPFASATFQSEPGPSSTLAHSVIFGGPIKDFPRWTIATHAVANTGSFLFTAAVVVQAGNAVRTFVVDPEMIIGTGGTH